MEEKIKVCPYCGTDRISYSFTGGYYLCLECGRTFVEPDIDNTKKDKMTKEQELRAQVLEAQVFERAHLIRIEYSNEKQKEKILKSLPRWVKIKIYKYDG